MQYFVVVFHCVSGLKAKSEREAQRNSSCHSICRAEGVKVFSADTQRLEKDTHTHTHKLTMETTLM